MKRATIIITAIGFLLWACKKGSDSFNSTASLFNSSIGMPPINLVLNGNTVIANDSFGVMTSGTQIAAGTYKLAFRANGATDSLYGTITSFGSGNRYTSIVYDSAAKAKLYFQQDNFPTTVNDGKCYIRFFNLIPNSSSIYLVNDTGTNTAGRVFISARTFGDFGSNNAFAEFDTTSRKLRVLNDTLPLSTIRFDSVSAKLDSTLLGLKNGKFYSLYLTGTIGGTGSLKPKLIVQQYN